MRRHARLVLRQLRISGQAASLRANNGSKFPFIAAAAQRVLGDRYGLGAAVKYESGGGGAVELEYVVLDRNRAFMAVVSICAPDLKYGGAMNFTASKIVLREHSQAGQSTGAGEGYQARHT